MAVSNEASKPKDTIWYINVAVSLCIMIFFRFIPAPDPITPYGMTIVGLFLGAIYGWVTTNMYWPALIALVLFGLAGGPQTPVQLFGAMLSNPNVALCFWLFLAMGVMVSTRLSEWIANWSFDRATHMKASPWIILSVALIAYIALASFIFLAAVPLFWPIFQDLFTRAGYKKGDKETAWITFALVLFNITALFIMPFSLPVVSNFGYTAAASGGLFNGTFNFATWIGYTVIIQAIDLFLFMVVSKFVFKIDLSKLGNAVSEERFDEKLNKRQKIAAVLIVLTCAALLLPNFFQGTEIYKIYSKLGAGGIGMFFTGLIMLIHVDGEPLIKFNDLADNILWPVIFLFGTALLLANAFNSPDAGVSAWLSGVVGPIFNGMDPLVFVIVFAVICLIATNIVNNVIVSVIMLTLAFPICQQLGVNPIALTAASILFIDFAFLLPSSSPAGAVVHSTPSWCPKKYIYQFGVPSLLILFLVAMIIGWPLANAFFPWTW